MKDNTLEKGSLIVSLISLFLTMVAGLCLIKITSNLLNNDRIFENKINQIEERLDNVSKYAFIQKTGIIVSKYSYTDAETHINHYMFLIKFDKDQKETIEVSYAVYMTYDLKDYFTYCVQGEVK